MAFVVEIDMKAENLSARAVLITGTSSGIGKASALHLDRLGYQVFAGVRKTADGTALQKTASPRLIPVHLDVTDGSSIAAAKALIAQKTGDSDLFSLVDNAGFGLAGPLEFQPVAELRQQMEVNLFGVVSVTQSMIPCCARGEDEFCSLWHLSLPLPESYRAISDLSTRPCSCLHRPAAISPPRLKT